MNRSPSLQANSRLLGKAISYFIHNMKVYSL
jgi:hypothetical protein